MNAGVIASFQVSIRSTLFIGQIFSLIPVVGIFSNNAASVTFEPISWKCVYAFLSGVGQLIGVIMTLIYAFSSESTLKATTYLVVYISGLSTTVMFFQIAKSWPNLVRFIAHVEEMDPSYDRTLKLKCDLTCAIVLILAIVQHVLSLLFAFANSSIYYPLVSVHEAFVRYAYPWCFNYLPYSLILGLFTQYLHMQATFIWNFSCLFITCMSYYLTSRLNHVNKRLLAAQGKYLPEIFWRGRREEYTRTIELVRKFDVLVSGVIFVTFANGLFAICLQLFYTLQSTLMGGTKGAVYYLFSLAYLLARFIALSMIASDVHSASSAPAPILFDVPSPVYGIEVQRFIEQVNGDTVALTGLQFFSITRGLLLSIAGTIVTYELVMIQYNLTPQLDNSTMTTSNYTNV